jgi:hypothetical protein
MYVRTKTPFSIPSGATGAVIAAAFAFMAFVSADPGFAASPAEIATQRQASLNGILTTFPDRAIVAQRLTCMLGEEPDKVTKGRQAGKTFLPDAADTCVAVLVRTAHDGHLPDLYRTLIAQLGGDIGLAGKLPLAIGESAVNGDGNITIGSWKHTVIPPPLAFDAGFTVAYLKGDTRPEELEAAKLKAVAEACLAVDKDAGTCFSAGYYYGAYAFRASNASSR